MMLILDTNVISEWMTPKRQGHPISQFDAQIAAICRTHQAAIVTRNVDDFLNCQIELINPWDT